MLQIWKNCILPVALSTLSVAEPAFGQDSEKAAAEERRFDIPALWVAPMATALQEYKKVGQNIYCSRVGARLSERETLLVEFFPDFIMKDTGDGNFVAVPRVPECRYSVGYEVSLEGKLIRQYPPP